MLAMIKKKENKLLTQVGMWIVTTMVENHTGII